MPEKREREDGSSTVRWDALSAVVGDIWKWDEHAIFHHPVANVPGYSEVVKNPVDLTAIKKKIEGKKYHDEADFQSDCSRMVTNCLLFNPRGSVWYKAAKKLRKKLAIYYERHGLDTTDLDFVVEGQARDSERLLDEQEKQGEKEDLDAVLKGLNEDMDVPVEVLLQRYKQEGLKRRDVDLGEEGNSAEGDDDDDEDEEEEEEEGSDGEVEESDGGDDSSGRGDDEKKKKKKKE